MTLKKWIKIFIIAFLLNVLWENLQSVLYTHYWSGRITEPVLLHAALGGAIVVTFLLSLARQTSGKRRVWFIFIVGMIFALFVEWWGLGTGQWAYQTSMPVLPLLNIGLPPLLQFAVTGYITSLLITL